MKFFTKNPDRYFIYLIVKPYVHQHSCHRTVLHKCNYSRKLMGLKFKNILLSEVDTQPKNIHFPSSRILTGKHNVYLNCLKESSKFKGIAHVEAFL